MKFFYFISILFFSLTVQNSYGSEYSINIKSDTNFLDVQKQVNDFIVKGASSIYLFKKSDRNDSIKISFLSPWMYELPEKQPKKILINDVYILTVNFEKNYIELDDNKYQKNDISKFKKYIEEKFKEKKLGFILNIDGNVCVFDIWDYLDFLYKVYAGNILIRKTKMNNTCEEKN